MSSARTKFDTDFEKHLDSTAISRRMLEIQTVALARIARLAPDCLGGIEAKTIAQQALCDSVKLIPQREVVKCQS